MLFACSVDLVQKKYGADAAGVLAAIDRLGPVIDVSGLDPDAIRSRVSLLESPNLCLIGGYDLIPPFVRVNPTLRGVDTDLDIPTDSPYGALPGDMAGELAPARAVSRIPDSATANATEFLAILEAQIAAPLSTTKPGLFEISALDFNDAMPYVRACIPHANGAAQSSTPVKEPWAGMVSNLSGSGRMHLLLHGTYSDPNWAWLWGTDGQMTASVHALSLDTINQCDLRGCIVTFSSCYAAMLDCVPPLSGKRTSQNQVAIACLARGAKVVVAPTRANWIDSTSPYDKYGTRLVAEFWRQLAQGVAAGEALRSAKGVYFAQFAGTGNQDVHRKTLLQLQCYGHPGATL